MHIFEVNKGTPQELDVNIMYDLFVQHFVIMLCWFKEGAGYSCSGIKRVSLKSERY